ncbi:unnamed protein product [Diabrotica balteata]|uniref:Uncharacterized protein n=1 Tax=Diabrotica balteata TaxID=107213 RepID=A0A9N9SZK8_DIABA|nr:unnamed protein product [Diabrotica balteata]
MTIPTDTMDTTTVKHISQIQDGKTLIEETNITTTMDNLRLIKEGEDEQGHQEIHNVEVENNRAGPSFRESTPKMN